MPTCSCNFQGALDALLSFDITEVKVVLVLLLIELMAGIDHCGLVGVCAVKKLNDIHERLHTINLEVIDDGGLADVLFRNNQPLELFLTCPDGDGKCTADRLQAAVKSQLAYQHVLGQPFFLHFFGGSKHADS